jgi:hypothetical protein
MRGNGDSRTGFVVGIGIAALRRAGHCIDAASAHNAGSPMTFGLPGMHVKPLFPSCSTTVFPFESISTILADFAISAGPADIALAIFASVVSPAAVVER